MRVGKKEGRGGRGADKEAGNEQDRSPRAEDGRLTPLRATSRAHGAIRLSTSHPEQINPPHSKLRATWGSLGQLHPIAPPDQAGSGSEARRELGREEAFSADIGPSREPYLRLGPGLARPRSFSLSPFRL